MALIDIKIMKEKIDLLEAQVDGAILVIDKKNAEISNLREESDSYKSGMEYWHREYCLVTGNKFFLEKEGIISMEKVVDDILKNIENAC